ncbi:hypothetical protein SPRG_05433 [Saprolegnia parasitica CBS 223.65]|uniref:Arf-GAP domain-containing protein n=1 Tax=Saprolegnia parasitica (strain CBS 223.65) TaxID=695850 RepID=A0A067CRR9_SAPPC|nr:hypothetical protein SPRG_05433 [Saprolegnia parasitica CBS 223.65]KDO29191.1 hypothetical protein SPRG_05433 [Saprolegnia parasitica CBS 223.65]|eukprot:XP_012200068.1 hypothetical protein SPRG_05433 [Saprolegnia parasitica CBS 223.65]
MPADAKTLDEKHIKAIRDFQKSSQSNRRCFDCNEMGPQYVCLDFNTFVCTACSGLHREFSHRIKSISMSSFTDTEVFNIVKHGGNDAARKYWLARFDINTQPSSNLNARDRIRNFIRDTYIDRRWVHEEPKKEAPKPVATKTPAPTPVVTTDFNPFHLPPPTANQQTSVAFGDFSSFGSTTSGHTTPASPAPTAEFADFSQFGSVAASNADFSPFASTSSGFDADFSSLSKPAPVQVDFFASPVRGDTQSVQATPPPAVASPASFPAFSPPTPNPFIAQNPFGAFDDAPQTADPFAAFSAPIQDPFAGFTSPQPARDIFSSPARTSVSAPFTPPRQNVIADPFAPTPPRHSTSVSDPFAQTSTAPLDPFNAFDSLFDAVPAPVVKPPAAPIDMWGHPPPANKHQQPTASPGKTNSTLYHSGASTTSYPTLTPFDHASPPLHPGKPHAYGSQQKADVSAIVDPFASLDIGIKSTPASTPHFGSNPSMHYGSSNQTFPSQHMPYGFPQQPPAPPAVHASTNPFDMF